MLGIFLAIKPYTYYQLNGSVVMPFANVSYPFSLYKNATTYVFDQNNGEAVHIWGDKWYYYLHTEVATPACFMYNVEWVYRYEYLPDLADYELQPEHEIINGIVCAVYLKIGVNPVEPNETVDLSFFSYEEYEQEFYCIPTNDDECIPVYWIIHGRNPVTDSHRDVYIYRYNEFDFIPDSYVFQVPDFCKNAEPQRRYLGGYIKANMLKKEMKYEEYDFPKALDLRIRGMSTQVKDQCTCGSCWAFGAAAMLEGRVNYHINRKMHPLVKVSEEQIISCTWKDSMGCFGGNPYAALTQIVEEHGGKIPLERFSPYMGFEQTCNDSYFTADYGVIDQVVVLEKTKEALKQALKEGPVSVGTAVPESYRYYAGGIYNDSACGYGADAEIVHVVAVVGYGYDKFDGEYWIIKNSWSNAWGVDGYMYLSTENDLCGILQEATIVTLKDYPVDPVEPDDPEESDDLFAIIFGSIIGAVAAICLALAIWMYLRKQKAKVIEEEEKLVGDIE